MACQRVAWLMVNCLICGSDIILSHTPPLCPLLLLLDGHSSHYTPSVISKAAEEGIIMFCLPPNSTHLTQHLDKGCCLILKRYCARGVP